MLSGLKSMLVGNRRVCAKTLPPLAASLTRITWSPPVDARYRPSGLKAEITDPGLMHFKVNVSCPLAASQILTSAIGMRWSTSPLYGAAAVSVIDRVGDLRHQLGRIAERQRAVREPL